MASVVSISHLSPALDNHYALAALARIWRRGGLDVRVGSHYDPDAKVCVLHHDRTTLETAPPTPPHAVHLNGAVLDISKRKISTLSLAQGDAWAGPVIIKTNANHFGVPDRWGSRRSLLAKLRSRLCRVSWRAARMLPEADYPILPQMGDVPSWVWRDSQLLVEKFLPERTPDGLYALRGWMFFGDKSYGYRLFSHHPLVKVRSIVRHEYIDQAPPALATLRAELGFDFGKFDYVMHDDQPIVFDVNKTPSFGDASAEETPRVRLLAQGIERYL